MSEVVVRMEIPKEGCHTCDARCVSALYGYICGIERKNVMPFLGKKNRPDWCPIICQLPEGHGRLIDASTIIGEVDAGYTDDYGNPIPVNRPISVDEYLGIEVPTIVPADTAEEGET